MKLPLDTSNGNIRYRDVAHHISIGRAGFINNFVCRSGLSKENYDLHKVIPDSTSGRAMDKRGTTRAKLHEQLFSGRAC